MKSLFVLALPRSLSSVVYHLARRSLSLAEPAWTTDGEILNLDRHVLFSGDRKDTCLKFLRPAQAPPLADRITAFLDQTASPHGFAYKDVVHPFICAAWSGLRNFQVLRIRRPLADVGSAIVGREWAYPGHAVKRVNPDRDDVLRGLLLAERALASVPAIEVRYDDLVRKESALWEALAALYPGHPIVPAHYLDGPFVAARERQLARRRTAAYHAIAERLETLSAEAGALDSSLGATPGSRS